MGWLPTINGSGWPFMSAGLMFWISVSLLPFVYKMWREKRHLYSGPVLLLKSESEVRMALGYLLTVAASSCFASIGWVRALMIEAGAFGDLAVFQSWARWYLMPPLTMAVILGAAMILWDFAAKWGKIACLVLSLVAVVFYFVGEWIDDYVIAYFWGAG